MTPPCTPSDTDTCTTSFRWARFRGARVGGIGVRVRNLSATALRARSRSAGGHCLFNVYFRTTLGPGLPPGSRLTELVSLLVRHFVKAFCVLCSPLSHWRHEPDLFAVESYTGWNRWGIPGWALLDDDDVGVSDDVYPDDLARKSITRSLRCRTGTVRFALYAEEHDVQTFCFGLSRKVTWSVSCPCSVVLCCKATRRDGVKLKLRRSFWSGVLGPIVNHDRGHD